MPNDVATALPDLSSLPAAALLRSSDSVLDAALRRIAAEVGDCTPAVAAFGNFAPENPGPN